MKKSSSASRMRVMNQNWSATKQHLHPQSVAEISRRSVEEVKASNKVESYGSAVCFLYNIFFLCYFYNRSLYCFNLQFSSGKSGWL